MKKKDLEELKKSELEKIAADNGIKTDVKMKKEEIIELILKDDKKSEKKNAGAKLSAEKEKKKDTEIVKKPLKKKDEPEVKHPNVDNFDDTTRGSSKKFEIEDKRAYMEPSYELIGEETYELPQEYGDTKVTLLVQDPFWFHAYWEINDKTRKNHGLEKEKSDQPIVIRVYNASTKETIDIDVKNEARSWYFNVPKPSEPYFIEIGVKDGSGKFKAIARSNTITVPSNKPSDIYDEEWMLPSAAAAEEVFKKSGGYVIHKQVGSQSFAEWQMVPSSVSSGGSGSGGVAAKKPPTEAVAKKRSFWAELHTELIVYGATEPDAKVTVGGVPVKLSPNGTFSIRFYLKDGEHSVPFVATSNDEIDTIEITPFVSKFTERKERKNK